MSGFFEGGFWLYSWNMDCGKQWEILTSLCLNYEIFTCPKIALDVRILVENTKNDYSYSNI